MKPKQFLIQVTGVSWSTMLRKYKTFDHTKPYISFQNQQTSHHGSSLESRFCNRHYGCRRRCRR